MKKTNLYKIIQHTGEILGKPANLVIFIVSAVGFAGLLAFFYGLFVIPVPGGALGFYRMEAPTIFEFLYLAFSALVSALIVTITIYSTT